MVETVKLSLELVDVVDDQLYFKLPFSEGVAKILTPTHYGVVNSRGYFGSLIGESFLVVFKFRGVEEAGKYFFGEEKVEPILSCVHEDESPYEFKGTYPDGSLYCTLFSKDEKSVLVYQNGKQT